MYSVTSMKVLNFPSIFLLMNLHKKSVLETDESGLDFFSPNFCNVNYFIPANGVASDESFMIKWHI